MHRQHPFDAFQFDDQAFFDDEIDAERSRQLHSFVDDRQVHFVFEVETGLLQLVKQAGIVRTLEQPGAERIVHFQRRTDHRVTRFIRSHVRSRTGDFVSFVPFVLSTRSLSKGRTKAE